MQANLTIIILTYNSSQLIKFCLQNINLNKYEIIIIDNASTDNTLEIISANFPQIKIIKNDQNIGYGRSNNIALRQTKTPFALLMNVDAIIDEEYIDKILNLIQQNQSIAIAGPMIYAGELTEGKIIKESLDTRINKKRRRYYEDQNFYFSQFITGAAMFLNMELMKKIGFFDEGFFLYCEDNEICKRVINKGYQTAIVKNTKAHHLSGKSSTVSPDEVYRIYWHRFGWSKLYYTEKVWGVVVGKLKAVRMILKFSAIYLKELILNGKVSTANKAALEGCLAYFIGIKAFDKNDKARGLR